MKFFVKLHDVNKTSQSFAGTHLTFYSELQIYYSSVFVLFPVVNNKVTDEDKLLLY